MIRLEGVAVRYSGSPAPTLSGVDLEVAEGELCLVVGHTGVGKSTLLGLLNGLVPHFTGGTVTGRVTVDGRDTRTHPPRELADVVGVVGQDPLAGFVTDTVEDELAYGMELLALPPATMRKRVEETLDLLGIADLRSRRLYELSGGQQQRVAIASVLTTHPRVLVLDEPTSALDPTAAEEVLAAVTRLVHDLATTVVMAEHRLERALQYADQVLLLPGDGSVVQGSPSDVMAMTDVAPPVVQLGRVAGWDPLPLSVRDARRMAGALRDRLAGASRPSGPRRPRSTDPVLRATGVTVRYGDVVAVRDVAVGLHAGEITALMGRNGSGKSSLLWALQGSGSLAAGDVRVDGADQRSGTPAEMRARVGLVPQTPSDLLYLNSVGEELEAADLDSGSVPGTSAALLTRIVEGIDTATHPRDLSEGQRLALVLAVQLSAGPRVLLLDEPTRGLDYRAKAHLAEVLAELAADGRAVVLSTHDVEFVAAAADRVFVLGDGEIVAEGPTAEVVLTSPAFAPQVAKVLAPQSWLTPTEVEEALGVTGGQKP